MKTYVNNASGVLKKVLLCPPTYFEFEPINVITEKWLDKGEASNKEACMKEHLEFQQAYRENGVEVVLMDPKENLPYEVFARDFGGCIKEGYIAGKFREPCRAGELSEYENENETTWNPMCGCAVLPADLREETSGISMNILSPTV